MDTWYEFGATESGLLGSRHYPKDNKQHAGMLGNSIEQVVCMTSTIQFCFKEYQSDVESRDTYT